MSGGIYIKLGCACGASGAFETPNPYYVKETRESADAWMKKHDSCIRASVSVATEPVAVCRSWECKKHGLSGANNTGSGCPVCAMEKA